MSASTPTKKYNLYGPEFKADPHPTYAAMRAEDPITFHPGLNEGGSLWFITRHEDVEAVLRDHKRFVKNYANTLTPEERAQLPKPDRLGRLLDHHMLNTDGADHARLRGLVNKAFTARMIQGLQGQVQGMADALVDAVESRGQMDLIDEYAFPLPINVICAMLGVPGSDRDLFRLWSDTFMTPAASPEEWEQHKVLLTDFVDYIDRAIKARRAAPRDDMITALAQAEEAGERLSEEELFSMIVLLIVAGHETTVNLIGNGMLAFLQHPEQWALVCAEPQRIDHAVEEILRYDGPVERATIRFAAEDVELGGQLIRRGEAVNVVLAGAGRDPARYPDPDVFDIARADVKHLGFGMGVHYCVGAPLARMEGKIALATLARRLPGLCLAAPVESLVWRTAPIIRGLIHLPVMW